MTRLNTRTPLQERIDDMVARYGEACKMAMAARIINRSPSTIRDMLQDGRLRWACRKTMVDVRSIAEYIMDPAENDYAARLEKRRRKAGISCQFHV